MTHPKGKFIYDWQENGINMMLFCQVTGKHNDVYVEDSLHTAGRFMPRHFFEHLIEVLTEHYNAVCSKPSRKPRARFV